MRFLGYLYRLGKSVFELKEQITSALFGAFASLGFLVATWIPSWRAGDIGFMAGVLGLCIWGGSVHSFVKASIDGDDENVYRLRGRVGIGFASIGWISLDLSHGILRALLCTAAGLLGLYMLWGPVLTIRRAIIDLFPHRSNAASDVDPEDMPISGAG